jgi:hypothetical protein
VVIGTDCIGSYESNYHTIKTTKTPLRQRNLAQQNGGSIGTRFQTRSLRFQKWWTFSGSFLFLFTMYVKRAL